MSPAPNTLRTYWLALLFALAGIALMTSVYARLPDSLPVLWGTDEQPIMWMTKSAAALLLPLVHLCCTVFLVTAPTIDPGSMRAAETPRFYPLVVAGVSCLLLFATVVVVATALGSTMQPLHSLLGGLGVLVALVGNYLGKLPRNYVVGIRTPWTLSSDYVWERTHRFAAPLFVIGGVALLLHCLVAGDILNGPFVATIIGATVLAPYCHSYATWKQTLAANGT
jgi:uncharacterized membrane protein